ncbi:MAG: cation diffusion facilitator family transporter [Atribacterota bacterium]|nr:cation diffusion facilitator family transporter [Atribacterota bacterium]
MNNNTFKEQLNNRTKKGILIASLSLVSNLVLAIFKYWIGIQLASIAILAETWHTLSDSLTSFMVIIGFRMGAKPPDKQHPFGHGQTETISSLIIAIILSLVAFNFFVKSINRLLQQQSVQYNKTALFIFIISLIVKEVMAQISIKTGKKIDSDSLIADGWHHRSDALASLIVIIGIVLNPYFWWADGFMGMIVSLIIAKIAFDILKDTTSILIGEKPEELFLEKLENIIRKDAPYNVQLHHIHLHRYGNHRELTFHIVLPGEMKLKQAHKIATQLEEKINSEMSVETTIHIESSDDKPVNKKVI